MIDFLTTRENTDPDSVPCARLLTTVITTAIEDASRAPSRAEKKMCLNIDPEAREAVEWLFGDSEIFELYASLIGTSAESIRRALRENHTGPAGSSFGEMQRRALHVRLTWAGKVQ